MDHFFIYSPLPSLCTEMHLFIGTAFYSEHHSLLQILTTFVKFGWKQTLQVCSALSRVLNRVTASERNIARVCAYSGVPCVVPSPQHITARLCLTRFRYFSITVESFIVPPQRGRRRHITAATVASSRFLFSLLSLAPNSLVCTVIMDHSIVFHTTAI